MGNYAFDIPPIIDAGVRVLVYSGTDDWICNYLGGEAWVEALEWSGQVHRNG